MSKVRIIIAGGRDFNDYKFLKESVLDIMFSLECRNTKTGIGNTSRLKERHLIEFVSGTAKGADTLGEKFAQEGDYTVKRFPANWDLYGKRAGFIRNDQMAKYAMEDNNYGVLIAFWDGKSHGTEYMINSAKKHGLETHVFNY